MKKLLLLTLGALAIAGVAWGQAQLTNRTMSGSEVVVVQQTGPGGPSLYAPTSQMRNSQGVLTSAQTTGTLVTTTATASLVLTGVASALTIDLPPSPWDGEIFEVIVGQGTTITAPTITQTDGSTIVNGSTGPTTAGSSFEWRYALSTNSWYKMR